MALYKDTLEEAKSTINENWRARRSRPVLFAHVETRFGASYMIDYTETYFRPGIQVVADLAYLLDELCSDIYRQQGRSPSRQAAHQTKESRQGVNPLLTSVCILCLGYAGAEFLVVSEVIPISAILNVVFLTVSLVCFGLLVRAVSWALPTLIMGLLVLVDLGNVITSESFDGLALSEWFNGSGLAMALDLFYPTWFPYFHAIIFGAIGLTVLYLSKVKEKEPKE